jgi:hypothetical protein
LVYSFGAGHFIFIFKETPSWIMLKTYCRQLSGLDVKFLCKNLKVLQSLAVPVNTVC